MQILKKLTAGLLALVMVLSLIPAPAHAHAHTGMEKTAVSLDKIYINPLYADVLTEADLRQDIQIQSAPPAPVASGAYVTTIDAAAADLRQYMKERSATANVYYQMPYEDQTTEELEAMWSELFWDIFESSMSHTGVPTEGDYLLWQYAGVGGGGQYGHGELDGEMVAVFDFKYSLSYYTTQAQENELDQAIDRLLSTWELESSPDYLKLRTIYDYITSHVEYDYENLENDDHKLKYTAYAALQNGTAVCQGYALLLYRLALELRVDCRLISGDGGGPHGWNIAGLKGKYYNLDSTWDAGRSDYGYFLRSQANFSDHTRDEEYDTSAFHSQYPMGASDYVPTEDDTQRVGTTWNLASNGTLTIGGAGAMPDYSSGSYAPWYGNKDQITKIVIEDGVTHLGSYAFYECTNAATIDVPDSVTSFGAHVFHGCRAVASIHIPTGITEIPASTFSYCVELEDITLPESVTIIGDYAFQYCTSLDAITLPQKLLGFGKYAFYGCTGLTSITFPASVTSLGSNTFAECTGLKSIVFEGDAPSILDDTFTKVTATAYYPDGNDTWTQDVRKNYGGTLTWVIDGHVHDYATVVTDPTCTEKGYTTYTCECGHSYVDDEVAALGHNLSAMTHIDGTRTHNRSCSRCDYVTEAEACSFGTGVVTAPTCTEDGYTTFTCSKCAYSYTDNETDALGHDLTNITHNEGTNTHDKACTRCDYVIEDEACAFGEGVVTAPTCTEKGYTTYTCACGNSYTDSETKALGHSFTAYIYNEESRTHTRSCSRCDYEIEGEACTFGEGVVTAPTCTTAGYTTHTCTICGGSYASDPIAALGHDLSDAAPIQGTHTHNQSCSRCDYVTEAEACAFDEGVVTKEPTETEDGVKTYTCTVCGNIKTEAIPCPEHEHKYTAVVTDPTCTEGGYTTYTCDCGESYVDDVIEALGHNLDAYTHNSETRTHTQACSRCDYVTDAEACTFDNGVVVTEPTPNAPGTKKFTCVHCGGSYTVEFTGEDPVVRISGNDRYATAYAVAEQLKQVMGVQKFSAIIVADGRNFPDALSGSYLSTEKDAPILLTAKGQDTKVLEYIQNNLTPGGKVYILGGTNSVSEGLEDGLKNAQISVTRLSGNDRYLTNLAILREAGLNGAKIIVSDAGNYADSLSASAANLPILLVNNKSKKLTADQVTWLESLSGSLTFCIVGGENSVDPAFATALEAYGTVERIAGSGREATSAEAARAFFGSPDNVVLAYSRNFPDGLCGGLLAYKVGAPLLLVNSGAEAAAADYVEEKGIQSGYILGGTNSVTEQSVAIIFK